MKEYMIWAAEKVMKRLGIPYEIAMDIVVKTSIGYCSGYLVSDYLDEKEGNE